MNRHGLAEARCERAAIILGAVRYALIAAEQDASDIVKTGHWLTLVDVAIKEAERVLDGSSLVCITEAAA